MALIEQSECALHKVKQNKPPRIGHTMQPKMASLIYHCAVLVLVINQLFAFCNLTSSM